MTLLPSGTPDLVVEDCPPLQRRQSGDVRNSLLRSGGWVFRLLCLVCWILSAGCVSDSPVLLPVH